MKEILRLENASFGYGSRVVVAGVNLVVHAGDFVGIAGPNGGGKTTLFRGMLGLLPAAAGRVRRSVRSVGYVPQREVLDRVYPLTVAEVVEMGAFGRLRGLRGVSREDHGRALGLLERVGLGDRASSAFTSLSGGQRQRVLIARALMVEPQLLLLDEPTSGVDRRAVTMILRLLEELNHEGLAVLLVSHQLGLLRDAVGRVLWVGGGGVRAGATEDLLDPENLDRLYGVPAPEPRAS